VISQLIKSPAEPGVLEWISAQEEDDLLVSAMSIFEIRSGVDQLKPSKKRTLLENWLTLEIMQRFAGRVVPIDERMADAAGMMMGEAHHDGRDTDSSDALIAATAKVLGLKIATLNRKHFEPLGVQLVKF
jgi:toxin FitB